MKIGAEKRWIHAVGAVMAFLLFSLLSAHRAQAAQPVQEIWAVQVAQTAQEDQTTQVTQTVQESDYERLFDETTYDKIVSSGNHSFRYEDGKVYIRDVAEADWEQTPMDYYEGIFSNGEEAYFMSGNILSKFVFSDRSVEEIKKVPVIKKDSGFMISAMKKPYIFITRSSFDAWENRTFVYHMTTGQLKKSFAGTICLISGNYAVGELGYKTDVSSSVFNLYKIAEGSLKKVKRLSKASLSVRLVKGKLYYIQYTDLIKAGGSSYYGMSKGTLYRCNVNGGGKKKLGTFKAKNSGMLYLMDVFSNKCTLMLGNKKYTYTYKTKKLKRKK